MLDKFKRYFSTKVDNTASAENKEEVTEMTTQGKQPDLAVDNKTAELQAQLATATETLSAQKADMEALTELVEELSTKFEAAQAALAASEVAQADLAKTAADKRLEDRTKAITEAVGTSNLETLLAATDVMSDEQFNVMIGAMAKSFEAEANSPLFKEKGVAAEVQPVETDAVTRLATNIAKEFKTE